ncbi:Uncharacterized protein Fot_14634 [Forsythia ovata]|uniref:Uncharacterized protein n=1 Tax=Forsythia ovata TaxID=205694 RepID=A0ABD1W6W0_9LAMI
MNRGTPLDFLTEDKTMSFSSTRGWPSSTYFIKVEKVLSGGVPGSSFEVVLERLQILCHLENLDPLVRHAIAASSALPDLRKELNTCTTKLQSLLQHDAAEYREVINSRTISKASIFNSA